MSQYNLNPICEHRLSPINGRQELVFETFKSLIFISFVGYFKPHIIVRFFFFFLSGQLQRENTNKNKLRKNISPKIMN